MAHERRLTHLLCGLTHVREQGTGDDEAISALAGRQHGVVARTQLLELGVSGRSIDHRVAVGRLRRVFPGRRAAYAVGHEALTVTARALAAAFAAGWGPRPATGPHLPCTAWRSGRVL
jgi:hypothetical protein